MEQTAVEWLVEKMIERKFFAKDLPLSYTTLEHLTNQAKQIEKNQIVSAFIDGDNSDCLKEEDSLLYALAYYNEKFNK